MHLNALLELLEILHLFNAMPALPIVPHASLIQTIAQPALLPMPITTFNAFLRAQTGLFKIALYAHHALCLVICVQAMYYVSAAHLITIFTTKPA